MNVVHQFKRVIEEQGGTFLFSVYCFGSKYNIQSNFNGSNTFGTMKISSRQG